MDSEDKNSSENAVVALNAITRLIGDIEKKVLHSNLKAKECDELKLLKEKCCDSNAVVSSSAFHGIKHLVERRVLVGSQTVSKLISLLPSIQQYGALVSTIGNILLIDLESQVSENGQYKCPYNMQFQHPFIIILKHNRDNSWFEIYHFVMELMQMHKNVNLKHKVDFIRPIFHSVFWGSSWQGSKFQMNLFNVLMLEFKNKEIMEFALESLLWNDLDIHYCQFLQEFFIHLLKKENEEIKDVVVGLSPLLAEAIKWLIINGYNPCLWMKILETCIEVDTVSSSPILFLLSDVIMETPSVYINPLVDICKSIILSNHCSKYIAYKFIAIILNWFVSPSSLANPVYTTVEEIIDYIMEEKENKWMNETWKLKENKYYKVFGSSKKEVKFSVDFTISCECWTEEEKSVVDWLKNLIESNDHKIQLKLHTFILGILLSENEKTVITLCLDLLFKLIEREKSISFPLLCLLFYKLGREVDPNLQKIFLFSLPKLSVTKGNIPLIVGIFESLKRGCPKIMTPLVIQLYLLLWKFDSRTYSYLHKILHESNSEDFALEHNISKAIAVKEICRLSSHLHAKDLVGVLSKILNECSDMDSGLPSSLAIEAVTELCKAYVIDASGTWNAIQPKLCTDKRPKVIISLCRFFGEIPSLNFSEQRREELIKDIVPMLWNYSFFKDVQIVKNAFQALSNFPIENLPLELFPEVYRERIKLPKDLTENSKNSEDVLNLPYVPAECWLQFLDKIDRKVLEDAGELVTVLIERELGSLPRGIFYLQPEKPEPSSYSYLPSRSICRVLVERLIKYAKGNIDSEHECLKTIIQILSQKYSRLLPPLNWGFLEKLISLDNSLFRHCIVLLAKQGSVSASAKAILENYFRLTEWESKKSDEILLIYNLLLVLCKSVSYNTLQTFLERTIELCLQTSLDERSSLFEKVIQNLTEVLKNTSVQPGLKHLVARQLEKIFNLIPAEHELMKKYATCAKEFPVKSIEEITGIKALSSVDGDWLRRAVTVRHAIAMREDIKNPLVWLNEFTEAVAHFPNEQKFILSTIWFTIRGRRECDHRVWVQELIWRIQASIASNGSVKVTLFLIDVFITTIVILSGYDCLFINLDEFIANEVKKFEIFPQAFCFLVAVPDWSDMLPKVALWIEKLLKWSHLPMDKMKMFVQALFTLREVKSFRDKNSLSHLFNLFSLPNL